ncbi:MAG: hypothetical protein ACOH2F_08180 [Cellulomonas sp.]
MDGVVGQGTLVAGRYRMLRPITSDLAGTTAWDANDQILDRAVRLTILADGRVAQAVDAARRAALVADPRLVRVLDVGDHEGHAYMITEPVTGPSLTQLVGRRPLPADQARAIIGEAASALEAARRRGVHHLTLRPSALHLTTDDRVLITGLAVDAALLGQGIGDARSTTRADTVGLVALLYAALTGRWPGAAHDAARSGGAQLPAAPLLEGRPVAPSELVAGIPNDLDTLCAVTLGPNDDGPHSPAELVLELEPWGNISAVDLLATASEPTWDPTSTVVASLSATRSLPLPVAPPAPAPTVQRQSVRSAFAAQPPGTAVRPATPPAAAPARTSEFGAVAGVGAAASAAAVSAAAARAEATQAEAARVETARAEAAKAEAARVDAARAEAARAEATQLQEKQAEGAAAAAAAALTAARLAAERDSRTATEAPAQSAAQSHPPTATAPPRRSTAAPSFPPTSSAAASSAASRALPTPPAGQQSFGNPPRPPAVPLASSNGAGRDLPGGSFEDLVVDPEGLSTKRFDPTRLVLAIVVVAVLVGLWLAFSALTAPIADAPPRSVPLPTVSAAPADPTAEPSVEPSAEPSPDVAPASVPLIASGQSLDPPPGGDNNEHPEAAPLAVDGDPATFWFTRTYRSADFGMKSGVGYAIALQAPATVTTVTLQVNGTGGQVEVRATDPTTPTTGTVLASGPLSATTVLTLSAPTETQSIVLWFATLPQTADGKNRVELAEVSLS